MIKKISFLLYLIFSLLPFFAIANDLTIYTYSSFNSEWGPGPKVFPLFEKKCSCKLKIVTLEDTGQLLARFLLEQKSSKNKLSKTDIIFFFCLAEIFFLVWNRVFLDSLQINLNFLPLRDEYRLSPAKYLSCLIYSCCFSVLKENEPKVVLYPLR